MLPTCLLAAHDPWFIQLLRIYSEESGFRVVQAFEGQDVIPVVYEQHPAVILLQIDLPGQIKGQEILQSLKKDELARQIPILVFSWQGAAEDELDGVVTQLQEPVTYEAFVDALKKARVLHEGKTQAGARPLNSAISGQTATSRSRKTQK